jgi:thiol-disulfide isomerase/thioredoxin
MSFDGGPARATATAGSGSCYTHAVSAPALESVDDHQVYRALDRGGDVVLLITSPFCGACKAMRRAVAELPAGIVDRILEADAGASPGLVADLEVFHLPALFLFRDGAFHRAIEAPPRAAALLAALAEAKAGPAREPP